MIIYWQLMTPGTVVLSSSPSPDDVPDGAEILTAEEAAQALQSQEEAYAQRAAVRAAETAAKMKDAYTALRASGIPEVAARVMVPGYTGPDVPPEGGEVTAQSVKADLATHANKNAGTAHGGGIL